MRILLAVDGSPYTQKMLTWLVSHDTLLGAHAAHHYTAITAQPQLPPRARAALGTQALDAYYAEEAEKIFAPVVQFLAHKEWPVSTISKIGPAGETIAQFAESEKYDLIVMGTHGHGALGRLVMGSVSTQVLANCTVPVLLVR